jgi:hypothetical protein
MNARTALGIVVVAGAVSILSACGSHSASTTSTRAVTPAPRVHLAKAQYVARMRLLGNRLGRAVDSLYPLDSGSSHSAVAKATIAKLEAAQNTVSTVERDARAIVPPPAARRAHAQLVAAVADVDGQIGKLAASLRANDSATFEELSQLPALREVNAATTALQKLGFDVVGG